MPEESQLIKRMRQGDTQALAEYLVQIRAPLLAFIQRHLGPALRSKLEPEDLLQDVSAEAVRCLGSANLADRDPFGWLCQIAERRTIDAHRRLFGAQKRDAGREVPIAAGDGSERGRLIDFMVATMTTASQAMSRNEREIRLFDALASLPEEQRRAIHLRYVEGLPTKEIAELLGKSNVAVRVMLSRTLDKLHQMLEPQE